MATIQSALAVVGLAKQTAFGTPAANPAFLHGLLDGQVANIEIEQEPEERTLDDQLVAPEVNRTGIMSGIDYKMRAHPKSVGLYLLGALGGVATSGVGPFTHVFTPALSVPYLTQFGKYGGNLYRLPDAKIDELEFAWEGNQPLDVSVKGIGAGLDFPGSMTATVDDQRATKFQPGGGTFQLDVASATPVAARIKSGNIKISNSLEAVMLSGTITPADVAEGRKVLTCGFTLVPQNFDDWRKIVTGTAAGASATPNPIYGSINVAFVVGSDTLTFNALRVPFTSNFPAVNAGGGAAEFELEGQIVLPASGAPLTVTLVNSQASY